MNFLPYDSDHASVIDKANLTSASDNGSMDHTSGSGHTYTEAGIQVGATQDDGTEIGYTSGSGIPVQIVGGHIRFEIESGFFTETFPESLTATLWRGAGSTNYQVHRFTSGDIRLYTSSAQGTNASVSGQGFDSHVEVVFNFPPGKIEIYVNRMLYKTDTIAHPDFTGTFNLSGRGTSGVPNTGYRIKNLQLSSQHIEIEESYNCTVTFLTDSFGQVGNYPLDELANLGHQGDEYADGSLAAGNNFKNRGIIPTVHSGLAMQDIYPTDGKLYWFGRGGATIYAGSAKPLSERVDALLNLNSEYPSPGLGVAGDLVIFIVGANDAPAIDAATRTIAEIEQDYKDELDRVFDNGARAVVLTEVTQKYDDPNTGTALITEAIKAINNMIHRLKAYDSRIRVCEVYQATADDNTLLHSDGLHPSDSGHAYIGKEIAKTAALAYRELIDGHSFGVSLTDSIAG